ncbi:Protein of unknown function [Escherichia coli D6-117.29]|nr:Protein of unknown function [Escherichia coli D6-117.29]
MHDQQSDRSSKQS